MAQALLPTLNQIYVVAKEAIFVSVVTTSYNIDVAQGFEQMAKDVEKCTKANDGQHPNCVMVSSTGGEGINARTQRRPWRAKGF
jgi:hypothetical protein